MKVNAENRLPADPAKLNPTTAFSLYAIFRDFARAINLKQEGIQFEEEGSSLGTGGTVTEVDFTGAGVTTTRTADKITVDIPGGSGGSPKRSLGMTFDGGGSTPTVGSVGYVVAQFAGTIDQWSIVADTAGSAVVDVWKAAGSIPTDANRIAGTEKLTLTAAQLASDTSLSTWTTTVAVGDVFGFELESVSTCTRLTCEVRIAETL